MKTLLKFHSVFFVLILTLLSLSCKKENNNPVDNPDKNTYEQQGIIGSQGGRVQITNPSSPIKGAFVEIPDGALSSSVNIKIQESANSAPYDDNAIVIKVEPGGLQFNKPIKIGLPYKSSVANVTDLRAFYFDKDSLIIQEIPIDSIDQSKRVIIARSSHFSEFYSGEHSVYADIELVNISGKIGAKVNVFGKSTTGDNMGLYGIPLSSIIILSTGIPTAGRACEEYFSLYEFKLHSTFALTLKEEKVLWFDETKDGTSLFIRRDEVYNNIAGEKQIMSLWSRSTAGNSKILGTKWINSVDIRQSIMSGKPLVFKFGNFNNPDPNKKYYVEVEWALGNHPDNFYLARLTPIFKFTSFKERMKFSELPALNTDANNNGLDDTFESSVVNKSPNTVSIIYPTHNSTDIPTSVNLQWSCSDPDGDQLKYDVYFGTVNPPQTLVAQNTTSSSLQRSNLNNSTSYYWKVVAKDEFNASTESQVVKFTTSASTGTAPTVTTTAITNITTNSATSGGNVTSQGSSSVTARGVCWNTSGNPTTANSKTSDGSGTGSFTSSITGLNASTTYYVKAYATNSAGTSYGDQVSFTTSNPGTPPSSPTLSSPSNGATGQSTTPTLSWDASSGATSYALQVSTNSSFLSYVFNQSGLTSTSQQISGLSNSTTYYWRVRATNIYGTSGWSSVWSFTTHTIISSSLPFYDDFESGGFSYGGWIVDAGAGITDISPYQGNYCATINNGGCLLKVFSSNLTQNNILYSSVIKTNKYSDPYSNAIISVHDANKNAIASVVFGGWSGFNNNDIIGVSGTLGIKLGSFTINNWYEIKIILHNLVKKYDVYIDNNLVGSGLNFTNSNNNYPKLFQLGTDSRNTTGISWFDDVSIEEIENSPPFLPSNPTPSNNATSQQTSLTLSWVCSDPDGDPLRYNVYFGEDNPPSNLISYNQSANSLTLSDLSGSTEYFWVIEARDNQGNSTTGPIWKFKTGGFVPSIPSLSSPSNGATGQSTTPTLSWDASSGATSYALQVSTNSSFPSYVYNQSNLTNTSQQVSGLNNSTTYYWRVSATNSFGTSGWSSVWSFTTISSGTPPTVTTTSITNITSTSASSGGDVTSQGSSSVTARGVCWNTSGNPTTANSKTSDGSGTGSFTSSITGLNASTTYYVKAYATNSAGTSYGDQVSFTTPSGTPCPGVPTVTYSGKTYNTVQIGSQCWLKENLDVGTRIDGNQNQTNNSVIEKYCYNNDPNNCNTYGGLYQWNEAMQYTTTQGTRGICPPDWHIPTFTELMVLDTAVYHNGNAIKAIGQGWGTGAGTNTSGFSALLSGIRDNGFTLLGEATFFWSCTEYLADAKMMYLYNSTHSIYYYFSNKQNAFSVRCLKDSPTPPTVTTNAITNITTNSASSGGDVTSQGSSSVTARGVCWSTSQNPTISDSKTVDGSGTGSFTSSITGLSHSTKYYVKAYATNSAGTSYGNQVSFTTTSPVTPCPGVPTVTYSGKTYNTVQIGSQCWLKENLDVGTRIDGNQNQTNNSVIEKYCYNNDPNNCNTYGGLYQWNEAMQYSTTPGTKGICPTGWHIPTQGEFQTLITSVGNDGNALKAIGQGFGSGAGTNTSGFSALLAGYLLGYDGGFYNISTRAWIWSSTETNPVNAIVLHLLSHISTISFDNTGMSNGFSVRCLKD